MLVPEYTRSFTSIRTEYKMFCTRHIDSALYDLKIYANYNLAPNQMSSNLKSVSLKSKPDRTKSIVSKALIRSTGVRGTIGRVSCRSAPGLPFSEGTRGDRSTSSPNPSIPSGDGRLRAFRACRAPLQLCGPGDKVG